MVVAEEEQAPVLGTAACRSFLSILLPPRHGRTPLRKALLPCPFSVHPVNGEVPPVKGRPWKLPHYANRGKTSSSGGELASARSCFSTVRTALGKLRITGLLARLDDCSEFSTVPTASATAADYMDKRTGSRFGIRKVPTTSPPPHLPDDPTMS